MLTKAPYRLGLYPLIALALLCLFMLPLRGNAQTEQGRITGTVVDANGGLVPGASIAIKNEKTGEERTTTTNDSGYYAVMGLKPSTYSVTASTQGLKGQASSIQ